jgi:hypothetical protein
MWRLCFSGLETTSMNAPAQWEGGKIQMKTSWVLPIAIILAAMGLLVDAPAQTQSASCYVSAGIENIHVMVRELDIGQLTDPSAVSEQTAAPHIIESRRS